MIGDKNKTIESQDNSSNSFKIKSKEDKSLEMQRLNLSYWLVSNKHKFKQILTITLIVIAGIIWLYSLIMWVDYGFLSGKKQRNQFANWASQDISDEAKKSIRATEVAFGDVQIFSSGVGMFDIIAEVENLNADWLIELDYRFVADGFSGNEKSIFVLPNELKYLTDLGIDRPFRPVNPIVEVINIKYVKVDKHKIPDYASWSQGRLNIIIENQKFESTVVNKKQFSTLTFDVINRTPYSYWTVGFYILLYRADKLIAVNYITAEQMSTDEKRNIQVQFYEGLPTVNKVRVIPDVNIFDPGVYMDL